MSKLSKIIVTILIVVVFFVLHAIVFGLRQSQGARTSGVLGLILFGGMIYAIRVIWKKTSPEAKTESNSATQNSSTVVPQATTPKYNNESIYDRLKRMCNPVNFMENYNKEKVEIANQIYSKLMGANPNTDEIAAEAEKLLGIQLVDNHQIEDLKNKLHPKNFMNPYDARKISLANEIYSRIVDNMTYSEYNKLIADAKPILDFWVKKEAEEAQRIKKLKEEREKREKEIEEQKRTEIERESSDHFYLAILGIIVAFVILMVWIGS